MSIHQPGNLSGDRMVSSTFDSIDNISQRYETIANDEHPAIILEESFWNDLQQSLIRNVNKKRQMLAVGGYTNAAKTLRTLENLAIRTAIEDFRSRVMEEPNRIHDNYEWDKFRARIREHTDKQPF